MSVRGICHLCGNVADLINSHIVSNWCWRDEIRNQDHGGQFYDLTKQRIHNKAETLPLMCAPCDGKIGIYENEAKKFNVSPTTTCGPWMLKFVTSVSWRVLKSFCLNPDLQTEYDFATDKHVKKALACWRHYLLHDKPNIDSIRHTNHLFLVSPSYEQRGAIVSKVGQLEDKDNTFVVFNRFASFATIGVIHSDNTDYWANRKSRVLEEWSVPDRNYCSRDLYEFLNEIERTANVEATAFVKSLDAKKTGKK